MKNFGKAVVRLRILIVILAFVLAVPAAIGMLKTRINYDILSYLPEDIDTMKGQQIMLDEYGKGGFALVVVEGMEDKDVAALKSKFEKVDTISEVLWYDSIADISIPKEVLPQDIYEVFNSKDGNSTMMAVFFDKATSADESLEAVVEMRKIAGKQCYINGMTAIVEDIKDLTMKETTAYVGIAVLLTSIILAVTMDSLLIPVFFMLSVGLAILYNLGTNIFLGQISFITQALTAVLQLAVTIDYSIFLWHSYKEQKERFADKYEAMAEAISLTISSVVSSSVTTVAGFLALCFMSYTLGLDMGIVMAKGVIIGVICCVTILPSMILVFDRLLEKTIHRNIIPSMDKAADFIVKHHAAFVVLFIALLIPGIYGQTHTDVYYNLTDTLPADLNSVLANTKLQEEFDISSTHIILCKSDLKRKDVVKMTDEMNEVDGVNMTMAFDTLIGSSIPEEAVPESISGLLKEGEWQLMLVGSDYKVASPEVNAQVDKLIDILKKYDDTGMVIGEAAATKDLISITKRDFTVVNTVSIAAIFVIIMIALRSFSLPIILVAVIEFAITVNMAVPCFTHTKIPFIASVVIGTIQLGATVDYAILMTTRYKQERVSGKDKTEAVTIALATSMKSIMVSALGFFASTFGVGLYSSVDMISQLCTLMSRGALISMVTVICALPSMLLLFDKVIINSTIGMKDTARRERAYSKPALNS
ncbi:MAG: MMPL family transporter [Ruminococcus sp.]|uniref:efflux RND transporter permease subunit n=1 Tax=Ruminococcus sp. TaxID=41978 RepID=UPI0025D7859E|nr:MMPL family transporter [Ruminococcus sp.]MBO4865116.1 MMPL family transporter [Ruminococcus sp.]